MLNKFKKMCNDATDAVVTKMLPKLDDEDFEYDEDSFCDYETYQHVNEYLLCKTPDNAPSEGMHRTYFACHPDDFGLYFKKVCSDFFSVNKTVAVYYINDPDALRTEEELDLALYRMELLIVPVTSKLLKDKSGTMGREIAYAKKAGIPILPLLMETNAEAEYSLEENFGDLQYLDPYAKDETQIKYTEKLRAFLESSLVDDRLLKRINNEFSLSVFLSYRKKDREYVDPVMRLIHSAPGCRDIGVWYDEFLTPGESFSNNIKEHLHSSDVVLLMVTPNLLEEPNGKPNYVMGSEYPEATELGKTVIPLETVHCDREKLKEKYRDLPEISNANDVESFKERFTEAIKKLGKKAKSDSPEHKYLIGMAYMTGVNTEINKNLALELITDAAEEGFTEAMEMLRNMYHYGLHIPKDVKKAIYWGEKLNGTLRRKKGDYAEGTVRSLYELGKCHGTNGDHALACEYLEKVHSQQYRLSEELDPFTLTVLFDLAAEYGKGGETEKQLKVLEEVTELRYDTLGTDSEDTISSLFALARIYGERKLHSLAMNLAGFLIDILKDKRAKENKREEEDQRSKELLELYARERVFANASNSPSANEEKEIFMLRSLAKAYCLKYDYIKGLKYAKQAYAKSIKAYGKDHLQALISLGTLAAANGFCRNFQEASAQTDELTEMLAYRCGDTHRYTEATWELGDAIRRYESALKSYNRKKKLSRVFGNFLVFGSTSAFHTLFMEERIADRYAESAKVYFDKVLKR